MAVLFKYLATDLKASAATNTNHVSEWSPRIDDDRGPIEISVRRKAASGGGPIVGTFTLAIERQLPSVDGFEVFENLIQIPIVDIGGRSLTRNSPISKSGVFTIDNNVQGARYRININHNVAGAAHDQQTAVVMEY